MCWRTMALVSLTTSLRLTCNIYNYSQFTCVKAAGVASTTTLSASCGRHRIRETETGPGRPGRGGGSGGGRVVEPPAESGKEEKEGEEEDEIVWMTSARYGRIRFGRCMREDHGSVGCSADVLNHLHHRCSGRRRCQLVVPDSRLHSVHPCPKELVPYLEATYKCVKGMSAVTSQLPQTFGAPRREPSAPAICGTISPGGTRGVGRPTGRSGTVMADGRVGHIIDVTRNKTTSGYITSVTSLESMVGSVECPWVIRADSGRLINLTIVTFFQYSSSSSSFSSSIPSSSSSSSSSSSFSSSSTLADGWEAKNGCPWAVAAIEGNRSTSLPVCLPPSGVQKGGVGERGEDDGLDGSGGAKERQAYMSSSHVVVVLIEPSRGRKAAIASIDTYPTLVIKYSEYVQLIDTNIKSKLYNLQFDEMSISCAGTGETYFLTCVDSQWRGELNNCTTTLPVHTGGGGGQGGGGGGRAALFTSQVMPYGVLLMIGLCVALSVACTVVLVFGLCATYRSTYDVGVKSYERRSATSRSGTTDLLLSNSTSGGYGDRKGTLIDCYDPNDPDEVRVHRHYRRTKVQGQTASEDCLYSKDYDSQSSSKLLEQSPAALFDDLCQIDDDYHRLVFDDDDHFSRPIRDYDDGDEQPISDDDWDINTMTSERSRKAQHIDTPKRILATVSSTDHDGLTASCSRHSPSSKTLPSNAERGPSAKTRMSLKMRTSSTLGESASHIRHKTTSLADDILTSSSPSKLCSYHRDKLRSFDRRVVTGDRDDRGDTFNGGNNCDKGSRIDRGTEWDRSNAREDRGNKGDRGDRYDRSGDRNDGADQADMYTSRKTSKQGERKVTGLKHGRHTAPANTNDCNKCSSEEPNICAERSKTLDGRAKIRNSTRPTTRRHFQRPRVIPRSSSCCVGALRRNWADQTQMECDTVCAGDQHGEDLTESL